MERSEPCYLDSSVLLAHLLREHDYRNSLQIEGEWITSEVTELECRRTLDRIRLHEHLGDEELADRLTELDLLLKSVRVVRLNTIVLKRAKAAFPTVVRSLDAIHLATAELAKCALFLTRDRQQAVAAKAIGLRITELGMDSAE